MPDLTAGLIVEIRSAGFRHVRFDKESKLECSKNGKEWVKFKHKAAGGGVKDCVTIPEHTPMDLDSL